MTEETAPETPAQTTIKTSIETMLEALRLSEDAIGYAGEAVYIDQGRRTANNPTLLAYIERARAEIERETDRQKQTIKRAGELIKAELDDIRGVLDV